MVFELPNQNYARISYFVLCLLLSEMSDRCHVPVSVPPPPADNQALLLNYIETGFRPIVICFQCDIEPLLHPLPPEVL